MIISRIYRAVKRRITQHRILKKHGRITKYHLIGDQFFIGDYTYGIPRIHNYNDSVKLIIGKFCSIADGVEMILGGNHHSEFVSDYNFLESSELAQSWTDLNIPRERQSRDIIIGNGVWIGRNALILSGAEIGDGAIVGAGAVVASKVPPYAVVAGNPAKIVKYRFTSSQRDKLMGIRWWDWPVQKIIDNIGALCSSDIDGFIAANG